MTRIRLWQLKNQMMFFNFIAIAIGVTAVFILRYRSISPPTVEIERLTLRLAVVFEPIGFLLLVGLIWGFERPIRRYLNLLHRNEPIPSDIRTKACQRLLNEPFFMIAIDFLWWLVATALYPISHYTQQIGDAIIGRALFANILIGLITTTAAFFILEFVLQKMMVPQFFPNGGLYMTPKTVRIRIRNRLAALLVASNLVPLGTIILILWETRGVDLDSAHLVGLLQPALLANALFGIVVGIGLTVLVSGNITRPLKEIIRVLKRVRDGHFDQRVRVTSNDEIGYTGDVINEMTRGLVERDRLRHALELAKEVQQNLLPKSDPRLRGLDIAGQSIYCERTGGDYYDYLDTGDRPQKTIGIVVGDVAGHGIPSALLMASVRSSLRQRIGLCGGLARVVSDVNRQLAMDVEASGSFMTMFCCEIDTPARTIRWVRAGHDPAMVYDPTTDTFEELKGPGLALGVDPEWRYEERQRSGLKNGQIIVIGTDGIWEAHNAAGQQFGKAALRDIVRQHSSAGAGQIAGAIVTAVNRFNEGVAPEDDVTLVVVKLTA